MDKESTSKLRLDTRLARRRGWIEDAELESELAKLPDVSSKVAGADGPEETPPASAPAAEPTPSPAHGLPEAGGS